MMSELVLRYTAVAQDGFIGCECAIPDSLQFLFCLQSYAFFFEILKL